MDSERINIHINVSKRVVTIFVSMCVGGLLLSVGSSFADNLRSTQTVVGAELIVPYDGYLMIDSAPITGTKEIKFELFEAASGGVAQWAETQTVSLYNGRFSVGLGTSTILTDTLLDAEKLWLAMTIIDTNSSGAAVEIPLSGRQAIEPAPFAAWAANSADMQVAGNLDVAGSLDVDGALDVGGDLTLADDRDIYGADIIQGFNDLRLQTSPSSGSVLLLQDSLITAFQDIRVEADLNILGSTTLGNGTEDDTTISGALTVTEDITMANDRDLLNTDLIQGFNDLRFRGSSSSSRDDLRIETDGTINIPGNLNVSGDITNLTVTEYSSVTASANLVGTSNSICFLSQVKIRGHNEASDESECAIEKSTSGGLWQIKRRQSGSGGPTCRATCLSW